MILMVCYLDQPLEVLAQQLNTRSVLIILSVFQLAFLLPRALVVLLFCENSTLSSEIDHKSHYNYARDRTGGGTCLGGWRCTLFQEFGLMRADLGHNIQNYD